jgi:hypothetical protein
MRVWVSGTNSVRRKHVINAYAAQSPRESGSRSTAPPVAASLRGTTQTGSPVLSFGGRPAEEVFSKLVEHAQNDQDYSIWGTVLVDSWLSSLRPGQRVPISVSGGVAKSLRCAEYSTYSQRLTSYCSILNFYSDIQTRRVDHV